MPERGIDGKCMSCGILTKNIADDGYICYECDLCFHCKSWTPRYYNNIVCFKCNKFPYPTLSYRWGGQRGSYYFVNKATYKLFNLLEKIKMTR